SPTPDVRAGRRRWCSRGATARGHLHGCYAHHRLRWVLRGWQARRGEQAHGNAPGRRMRIPRNSVAVVMPATARVPPVEPSPATTVPCGHDNDHGGVFSALEIGAWPPLIVRAQGLATPG